MAKFAQSQNGQLTLVFENYEDLVRTAIDMVRAFDYFVEKYKGQEGTLLTVLKIDVLGSQTSGILN